jgi:hypothetical protein
MGSPAEGGQVMDILDCEQGGDEWKAARCGLVTASRFATVLAKGKDGGASLTRATYMRELAGEIITGEPAESFSNGHMERGKAMEGEARDYYAFVTDAPIQRVGFIRSGPKGCSPDSLIGTNGALEIKTALPHILIELLTKDKFPPEHKAQCQGVLWVAEREWIDLAVYWPKMPTLIVRATRDEEYIKALAAAVDQFNEELAALVDRIRRYGAKQDVAA